MNKKIMSVILCCTILMTMASCANKGDSSINTQKSIETKSEEIEQYTEKAHVDRNQKDKAETVFVETDAYGNPIEKTVTVTLRNPGGLKDIIDETNLVKIRNVDGNEEYVQENNKLVWENHGKDITYKGQSQEELPISVAITYYLDDKEISAEELAGKSGHVKIRFDYTNNSDNVTFVCMTFISFDGDKCYNISSEDGKVINYNGNVIALGLTTPGLNKYLKLNKTDMFKDIKLKDAYELELDTDFFELDFTETIVTNGLLEDIDDDDLKDMKERANDMSDAGTAANKLKDGVSEFKRGINSFKEGLEKYTQGVDACAKGAESLEQGLKTLVSYKAVLPPELGTMVDELYSGAKDLSNGLDKLSDSGDELTLGTDSMLLACNSMDKGVKELQTELLDKMVDNGNELSSLIKKIEKLKKKDSRYCNFSGISEGATGSVMFMIETEEIKVVNN